MNRIIAILAALVILSCAGPRSEQPNDSLALESDTLAQADDNQSDNYYAQEVEDSRRPIQDIQSNFSTPQLSRTVAYAYRAAGLHLYKSLDDAGDTTRASGVAAYGSRLTVAAPLENYRTGDTEKVDGFLGRYIEVTTSEGPRYVFSGYLSNFPVPAGDGPLVDYFLRTCHLLGPPDQQRSGDSTDIYIASQYNDVYDFEGGIKIEDHGYYEGSGTEVLLPEWCSLQEGFLLLRTFRYLAAYATAFQKYPEAAENRPVEEGITAVVELDAAGRPATVKVIDETGCYDETFVTTVNGRVQLSTGGGC